MATEYTEHTGVVPHRPAVLFTSPLLCEFPKEAQCVPCIPWLEGPCSPWEVHCMA